MLISGPIVTELDKVTVHTTTSKITLIVHNPFSVIHFIHPFSDHLCMEIGMT